MPKNIRRGGSQSQTVQLLQQAVAALENSQTSGAPERPDVRPRAKPKRDRIYSITQNYNGPNIVSSTITESAGAIQFSLSSIANVSSYTTIFDKYRIKQVRVRFVPYQAEGVITSGVTAGPLYTVLDYDDNNSVTVAQALSYDNLKMSPVGAYFERTLTPKVALAAYSGSVFTAFAQAGNSQWLDAASPGIPYYGLKYALPVGLVATGTIIWTTIITIELEFSHPR